MDNVQPGGGTPALTRPHAVEPWKRDAMKRTNCIKLLLACVISVLLGCSENSNQQEKNNMTSAKTLESNMIFVKGGCFQMGDPFNDIVDTATRKTELQSSQVCLEDYNIGRYEVSQAEWQGMMGKNPSANNRGINPVENVSYNEVQEFIRKLNSVTGKRYRLPTEAEWEYAARSGGKPERWSGTANLKDLSEYSWFSENSERATHEIGKKKPNGLGVYDMTGNVEEMMQGKRAAYDDYPTKNDTGPGPLGKANFIHRGGSFGSNKDEARVFARSDAADNVGRNYIGFRLVRSAKPEP